MSFFSLTTVVTPSQCPWDHFIQLFRHWLPKHMAQVILFSLPGLFYESAQFQYVEDTYIEPKISLEFQGHISTGWVSSPLRCFVKYYVFGFIFVLFCFLPLTSALNSFFCALRLHDSLTGALKPRFLANWIPHSLCKWDRGRLKAGARVSIFFAIFVCMFASDGLTSCLRLPSVLLLLPSINRDSFLQQQLKPFAYFPAIAGRASTQRHQKSSQCPIFGGLCLNLWEPSLWVQTHCRPFEVPVL